MSLKNKLLGIGMAAVFSATGCDERPREEHNVILNNGRRAKIVEYDNYEYVRIDFDCGSSIVDADGNGFADSHSISNYCVKHCGNESLEIFRNADSLYAEAMNGLKK